MTEERGYHVFLWNVGNIMNVFTDIALMVRHAILVHRLKKITGGVLERNNEKNWENYCTISTEVDLNRINICFGMNACRFGYTLPVILPEKSIIVNMEQTLYSEWMGGEYISLLEKNEVWDYNLYNQIFFKEKYNIDVKLISFGYVPLLESFPEINEKRNIWESTAIYHRTENTSIIDKLEEEQNIDVLFYGVLGERRIELKQKLDLIEIKSGNNGGTRKLNVQFTSNLYGKNRDQILLNSKIVLNIHYKNDAIFEIPRVSHLLNNRKFIISEKSITPDQIIQSSDAEKIEEKIDINQGIVICSYSEIPEKVKYYLENPIERFIIKEKGYQIHKRMIPEVPI